MVPKAPLWRPFVTAAAFNVVFLLGDRTGRLEGRRWQFYVAWAVFWAVAAVGVWAIQRWRGRDWGWALEAPALFGLLMVSILVFSQAVQFLRPPG